MVIFGEFVFRKLPLALSCPSALSEQLAVTEEAQRQIARRFAFTFAWALARLYLRAGARAGRFAFSRRLPVPDRSSVLLDQIPLKSPKLGKKPQLLETLFVIRFRKTSIFLESLAQISL